VHGPAKQAPGARAATLAEPFRAITADLEKARAAVAMPPAPLRLCQRQLCNTSARLLCKSSPGTPGHFAAAGQAECKATLPGQRDTWEVQRQH